MAQIAVPPLAAPFSMLGAKLPHLLALGINALEPLPITEFEMQSTTSTSMGYNGCDFFSPEMRYAVTGPDLDRYLILVNGLLRARGKTRTCKWAQLESQVNQLKAFIDICHLNGIAVLLDVVYNHGGAGAPDGARFDAQSLYFFDFAIDHSDGDSLYFTDVDQSGGRVFDYQKPQVRQFLVDNARFFYDEYHVDGFRFDEVTVIDGNGGWGFCQQLTDALHKDQAGRILIAEYWRTDQSWVIRAVPRQGAGFDAVWTYDPRNALRDAVGRAATAYGAPLDLTPVFTAMGTQFDPGETWRAVNCVENHDKVYSDHDEGGRVAQVADGTNACSLVLLQPIQGGDRLAAGPLPELPMLFMGQEVLEYRPWNDNLAYHPDALIHWEGVSPHSAGDDFLMFTRAIVALRKRLAGLRGESFASPLSQLPGNRVLAVHRWVEFEGWDVVIVASLNETPYFHYVLGFPHPGRWREVFNSDYFEGFPNPGVVGNGGFIDASGPPTEEMPYSATIVIPANSVLVFVPD